MSHGVSEGGSESTEAVSCSAMQFLCPYALRGIFQHEVVGLVDSSTEMRLPPTAVRSDWMGADAVAVQKIPGRVLETPAQPLGSGGAGQRGRRDKRAQSRRSEKIQGITAANVDWQRSSTFHQLSSIVRIA